MPLLSLILATFQKKIKKKFHYFRQNGCVLPCNMLYLTCK
nr:MAG TPA: hypothetical protein [Caudoviricetes sp.]